MENDPRTTGTDLTPTTPYGVYTTSNSGNIQTWNQTAEQITGLEAKDVIGQKCYVILMSEISRQETSICADTCPFLQAVEEGRVPEAHTARISCTSGPDKLVQVKPMIIAGRPGAEITLFHIIEELNDSATTGRTPPDNSKELTRRETQVLQLTALGMTPREIARELHLSYHTVRNYIATMRRKLGARTKLDLVRIAQELGTI